MTLEDERGAKVSAAGVKNESKRIKRPGLREQRLWTLHAAIRSTSRAVDSKKRIETNGEARMVGMEAWTLQAANNEADKKRIETNGKVLTVEVGLENMDCLSEDCCGEGFAAILVWERFQTGEAEWGGRGRCVFGIMAWRRLFLEEEEIATKGTKDTKDTKGGF